MTPEEKLKAKHSDTKVCEICTGSKNLTRCPVMCGGTFEYGPIVCKECVTMWHESGETDPEKLRDRVLTERGRTNVNKETELEISLREVEPCTTEAEREMLTTWYESGFEAGRLLAEKEIEEARMALLNELKTFFKANQELGHAMESNKLAGVVRMSVIFEKLANESTKPTLKEGDETL